VAEVGGEEVGEEIGEEAGSRRAAYRYLGICVLTMMISKSNLLMVAFLQVTLLGPTSAADSKSDECGLASVYSTHSEATASAEDTQPENFTAAHRSLPFGTLVHVDNQKNGRSAIVRITDRGPFTSGRIIDLSQVAARELRISGLTQVCLNILSISEN
jgi:rare lipoprotein A